MKKSRRKSENKLADSVLKRRRLESRRRQLDEFLSRVHDDEAFLRMLWAMDAIEDGDDRSQAGWSWFYRPPQELLEILNVRGKFFHKWLIETLANELIVVNKARNIPGRPSKIVDCHRLEAAVQAVNLLHKLEDAEDGLTLRRVSVFTQMHRMAQRQFPWQRGKVTRRAFYRSSFLYTFPEAQEQFQERYGISICDFSLVAFSLYALFEEYSGVKLPFDVSKIGIDRAAGERALQLLTVSLPEAQAAVRKFKAISTHTSYTASVFRSSPIVRFPKVLVAPVPDLIIERITEGLYYDIITKADGATARDISAKLGKVFEKYCYDILIGYLSEFDIIKEFQYNGRHSPDLMMLQKGKIAVAIECKAKKEPIVAKFGEEKEALHSPGIDDLAKGIFQIWRFLSHVRRGIARCAHGVEKSVIGLLLTLDTWLEASDGQRAEVRRRAGELADLEGNIIGEDRCPIALCHVRDLEALLACASDQDVLRTLAVASTPERQGWTLEGIYHELTDAAVISKPDPFADRLNDVAPWIAYSSGVRR
ncbi:hypothetical protein SAMN02745172_03731 [Pseudoxanthobacter soli DSM 19599]|uniref:Uncharacterized protein n=2 Tax=Pseudoxanthobacter TaxID=433838 RepID=A0A1M7ZQ80_9HYPH|nr:hypothetical protein SAMN02745172_03731 [Pseudoxanthobacter soli DSM 19599]